MTAPKVETREDEEQGHKFDETIQLLLAAGYFRARIKGLSPFDKVVGGMTWCISTCDFDIDVDLLFQENSTIGQKIALTEKIVAVLPKMKCPHRIEPHQIQGLDFIHIFPVIQWLVKRAIETREEMGDKIRAYSISQFNKSYTSPQDELFIARKDHSIKTLQTVNEAYKPKRVYKKPEKYARADEETQVYTTLLEYGQNFTRSSLKKSEKQTKEAEKESEMAAGLVKVEVEVNAEKEEKRIKSLMEGMSQTDIQQMLSSRAVGSIVELQVSQITEMVQEYTQRTQEHEQSTHEMKTSGSGINAHNRHVQTVQKQIEEQRDKVKEAEQQLQEITDASQQLKVSYKEKVDYSQRLIEETEKLEQTEADEINKSILTKLRSLVALNEQLKKQEHEFKAQCKIEVKELEAKLAAAQGEVSEENNSEAEKLRLISEQNDKDNEKLKKIRLLLAKRNREIASLQWKIDDVPSRAELSQYQKRFIELYNQVASTHKETKQFYTLFNTLDDTKLYLEKEVGLLNSIHDNFETASSQSAASKEEFLTQLENIVKGVKNNQDKVDKRRALEKSKKDEINAQHMQAVEKQRLYVKTVKEFQEECKKSEIIQSKLRAAGIKA